jgi:transcriptional regulator with XRE-family HTH domain
MEASRVFRENVSRAMKGNGLTQKKLAEKAGITEAYMNRVLRGTSCPTVDVCEKIAAALEVQVAALFIAPAKKTAIAS